MPVSEPDQKEIAAMPAGLRALLEAKLAAGNEIAEVGHTFPAPPAGAYFRLTKPLLTQAPLSDCSLDYSDPKGSMYSDEITDAKRFYFLPEPPRAPEPDTNAVRAARSTMREKRNGIESAVVPPAASVGDEAPRSPVQRFKRSMIGDFEKWHDGIGYDFEPLRSMSPAKRESTEAMLINRGVGDWRDVEALACFRTPAAEASLRNAMRQGNPQVRNAVARHAPDLITDSTRIAFLVEALQTALFFGGMGQALDQVADFHPAPIVEVLFRGALDQSGDVAVHFAAMLCYIHGQTSEPFDLAQRRFFLRFNTCNRAEREAVFRELCERLGIDADRYLPAAASDT